MCQPAPGPRCASDLRKSLAKNKERKAALASASEDSPERHEVDAERQTLLFELAGTRTGQADLNKRIGTEANPAVKADLEAYRDRARAAYVSKMELLRSVEAALTEQPATETEHDAPETGPAATSAVSYTGKGGKGGGAWATPEITLLPATESTQTNAPSHTASSSASAASYTGKGGKHAAVAPSGSYLNPTRESIAAEVSEESALRDQIRDEHAAQEAAATPTSASSYTGKGGKGSSAAPAPRATRRAPVTPSPARPSTSASSYTGKGGKGGAAVTPPARNKATPATPPTSAASYTRKSGK